MPESAGTHRETKGTALIQEGNPELALDLERLRIEPIAKSHNRSAFMCTNETIQNYCRMHARQNNDTYKIRAFVACFEGSKEVLGYYYLALTFYLISEHHLDDKAVGKFEGSISKAVPAVYLGMIGVHTEYQGKGIGYLMMMDAIQRTAKIARHAGLYALTLDAINEGVADYYTKFGFERFKAGTTGLEMFLSIRTILSALPG